MPKSKKSSQKKPPKKANKKKTKDITSEEVRDLFARTLLDNLLNMTDADYEDSYLDDDWDGDDIDFTVLTPKEIIEILNSQGGDFTLSEGKAIKKFVTFIEDVTEDDFEEFIDLDTLDESDEQDEFDEGSNTTAIQSLVDKQKSTIKENKKRGKKPKTKNQVKTGKKSESSSEEVYIIETKFGSATRTIALKPEQTLDDLHLAIQEYYNWDNDHLYAFYMDNKPYSNKECYNHPMGNEPPFANKIKLKDLNLRKNKKFLYLFDFGDDNIFDLKFVEKKLNTDFASQDFPLLVSKKGRNPRQYDYY